MRRTARIVFVLGKFGVGGAEKQLANLIAHRPERARGLDVHVITLLPTQSSDVEQRFFAAGASTSLVDRSMLAFPHFFYELFAEMRRLRPVVVSTILDSSVGAWGRLAAWLSGAPVIVHSDRQLAAEGTRAHLLLRPFLDRRTTRFLPNAHAIARRLEADGVLSDKIVVMPNGVDTRVFDPAINYGARSTYGIADAAIVLGFLGRFAREKRVDLLIDALQRMPLQDRPDHVLLAGDGVTLPEVRALAQADAWTRERCTFIGTIDDTVGFLASIDVLVLPSDAEGLPNVVLEAMAMARPVIGTAVSEVPHMVADTGIIVPPGDAEALAGAIGAMRRMSSEERRELGLRARRRAEQEYDIVHRSAAFWDAHLDLLPRQFLERCDA